MKSIHRFVAIALLITTAFGCATIMNGRRDYVPVNTNPEGASIYLNDKYVGKTPNTVQVRRKEDAVFRFELEGYETAIVHWDKVLNGWFLGNILIGGLIGIGVDLLTHNQGKHSTNPLVQELKPLTRTPATAAKGRH